MDDKILAVYCLSADLFIAIGHAEDRYCQIKRVSCPVSAQCGILTA